MESEHILKKYEKLLGDKIELLKRINQLTEENLKLQEKNLELRKKNLIYYTNKLNETLPNKV